MLGPRQRRLERVVPLECRGLGIGVSKIGGVSAELVLAGGPVLMLRHGEGKWHCLIFLLLEASLCEFCLFGMHPKMNKQPPHYAPQILFR